MKYDPWRGEHEDAIHEAEKMGASAGALSSLYYGYATALRAKGDSYEEERDRALELSDEFLEELGGLAAFTADQLDVRASVLLLNERYDDAHEVLEEGLSRDQKKPHTEALLRGGRVAAFVHEDRIDEAAEEIKKIESIIPDIADDNQRVRTLRILIRFYKHVGDEVRMAEYVEKVRALIEKTGATDQLKKLEADLR